MNSRRLLAGNDGCATRSDGVTTTSVTGAKVEVEEIAADGSTRKIGSYYTDSSGEFSFRRKPGKSKLRVTASLKGVNASKDLDVEEAAIYRVAISLDLSRTDKD